MSSTRIQLVESFYAGSHQYWADKIKEHSRFEIELNTLKGRHWKWRMSSGSINLARQANLMQAPEAFICTDMVDVATFRALLDKELRNIAIGLYMHENQLYYPSINAEQYDRQYALINFRSAIAADRIYFNSQFHMRTFYDELPKFLKPFPDKRNLDLIPELKLKSSILYLGIDQTARTEEKVKGNKEKVILWNHRWEHDKNPEFFFKCLSVIKQQGVKFKLIAVGEKFGEYPAVFDEARTEFKDQIIHWGYCESRDEYLELLSKSDILPVTSLQEYFGLSVMEAIASGVQAILPNRLVYPELYGSRGIEFYSKNEELTELLFNALEEEQIRSKVSVEEFYWKNRISQYDQALEALIKA